MLSLPILEALIAAGLLQLDVVVPVCIHYGPIGFFKATSAVPLIRPPFSDVFRPVAIVHRSVPGSGAVEDLADVFVAIPVLDEGVAGLTIGLPRPKVDSTIIANLSPESVSVSLPALFFNRPAFVNDSVTRPHRADFDDHILLSLQVIEVAVLARPIPDPERKVSLQLLPTEREHVSQAVEEVDTADPRVDAQIRHDQRDDLIVEALVQCI